VSRAAAPRRRELGAPRAYGRRAPARPSGQQRLEERPPTCDGALQTIVGRPDHRTSLDRTTSSPQGAGGGRLTLGDLVAGAWEGLLAAGSAVCPVCGGRMSLDGGAGHCGTCGSWLS
jgi:hypothetical protein